MLNAKDIGLGVVGFGKDVLNVNYSMGRLVGLAALALVIEVGSELVLQRVVKRRIESEIEEAIKSKTESLKENALDGIVVNNVEV